MRLARKVTEASVSAAVLLPAVVPKLWPASVEARGVTTQMEVREFSRSLMMPPLPLSLLQARFTERYLSYRGRIISLSV